MKLLIIPSWYPSGQFPSTGIFFKEQAQLLARQYPDWQIGISIWGSHEPRLWIRVLRPLDALLRLTSRFFIKPYERLLEGNCVEFFTPAHTWTRRIKQGNIDRIVRANERNLNNYIAYFGKPDIIQADIAYPAGKIAMELSEKYNIPYFIKEQMSPFPMPSFRRDYRKTLLPQLRKASAVLSVGKNLQQEMAAFGIDSAQTINFIDMEYFVPATHTSRSGEVKILALGRLEQQKGFDLLLDALHDLPGSWQLRLGGTGSERKSLQKRAKENGLHSKVRFLGHLDREGVRDEMQSCDFFVLSSRHESFGVVLIEAMACGKPLLVTNCGGITGSLPEEVAIRCDPEVSSLQAGLIKMMKEYVHFKVERIRSFVLNNYDVRLAAQQVLQLAERVVR